MKVLLLDDERSMLLIMKKMLSKIPDMEIAGCFQSAREAYGFIKENRVDMAFVDISMPGENGLDFARRTVLEIPDIFIVFLTAHKEYALEAFDVHAFDYIIKPVSQARLEHSVQRAKQRFLLSHPARKEVASPKLFAYCFGGMDVGCEELGTVQFSSSKSSELLAYLLLKKGRFVSKWSIMEEVFRGRPPQNAETYLNTTVYKLRKALEPHGLKSAVISAEESYKIDLKDIYVDFIDFEDRLSAFSSIHDGNLEEAMKTERLFTGELFGAKDYYWSLPQKERLTEVYFCFAKKLADHLLAKDQLAAALQILKKLVFIDELDEETNCLLMRAYAAQRDRLSLERQYMRYAESLHKELGISPDRAVANLYAVLVKSLK